MAPHPLSLRSPLDYFRDATLNLADDIETVRQAVEASNRAALVNALAEIIGWQLDCFTPHQSAYNRMAHDLGAARRGRPAFRWTGVESEWASAKPSATEAVMGLASIVLKVAKNYRQGQEALTNRNSNTPIGPREKELASAIKLPKNHKPRDNFRELCSIIRSELSGYRLAECHAELIAEYTWLAQQAQTPVERKPKRTTDPVIISLGNSLYQIDCHDPVPVTDSEDAVLSCFLELQAMSQTTLVKKTGKNNEAPRILGRLTKKYKGIFAPAIHLPGAKGEGGYRVNIRRK